MFLRAIFFVFLCVPALLRPDALSPATTTRPFLRASAEGLRDFGLSPLRMDADDIASLALAGIGLGLLVHVDVPLYAQLAKGEARKEWLDHSMPAASALGEGLIEFSAAALASKLGDERLARTSATAMQGLVVVAVYGQALKMAAWSNRPYQNDREHRYWAFDQDTLGMPSGHSFSAFCAAEVYGAEYGRALPYALAGIVAYSRIYNQAHWPSDVWVGSLLGIAAGAQARRATEAHGPPGIRFSVADRAGSPLLVAHVVY